MADRTYDIETLQSIAENQGNGRMYLTLGSNSASRSITGLQKLIQRYVTLFLTPKGTVEYHQNQGSQFMVLFSGGNIQTRNDVVSEFAFANIDVITQLKETEQEGDPDDERIKSARLIDYAIFYGTSTLYLKVRLTSQAGEYAPLIIPTA